MPIFNNMAELEAYLNGEIRKAMETEVAQVSKETMQENIQKVVYDAYTPYSTDGKTGHYERTGQLLKDVEANMINDNTLVVEDTRQEKNRDIVKIIEEGKGYKWGYRRNLNEEIGARPFVEETAKDLENGLATEALRQGLKSQGIDVE